MCVDQVLGDSIPTNCMVLYLKRHNTYHAVANGAYNELGKLCGEGELGFSETGVKLW
jgi:hypothetical protein